MPINIYHMYGPYFINQMFCQFFGDEWWKGVLCPNVQKRPFVYSWSPSHVGTDKVLTNEDTLPDPDAAREEVENVRKTLYIHISYIYIYHIYIYLLNIYSICNKVTNRQRVGSLSRATNMLEPTSSNNRLARRNSFPFSPPCIQNSEHIRIFSWI